MLYTRGRRKLVKMALEEESSQDSECISHQIIIDEHSDGEAIMERQQFLQESLTDMERECSRENQEGTSNEDNEEERSSQTVIEANCSRSCGSVDPQEGPSGIGQSPLHSSDKNQGKWSLLENVGPLIQESLPENEQSENVARLERYGNYLERYGPQLERYGTQLEKFGSQLERIGPQLERCGNNLERYAPQLEAIGRQLVRSQPPQVENNSPVERPRNPQLGNMSLQTQTESGNEGFAPQSADSCQGLSASSSNRQGQWMNSPNPRRLSRRPSFQVNDGIVRHWMRRRNMDSRDLIPFNRFREDRRRSLWRNDGDLRDFRRPRTPQWRYHDNLFNRQHMDNGRENNENDENAQMRVGRLQLNEQQENAGLLQQDHVRIPRNEGLHQDDPDYGFVLVDDHNSPGPSRPDTSSSRRPRSHMSLRPLNVFNPPLLGSIAEYNAESDEDNNDQRQDVFGRRAIRGREGSVIRSWVMMNNYLQTRPLFIGQGDSKAIDGQFSLQRIPQDDHFYNGGNERNVDVARVPRPIPRNQRAERRQQRQQLAFQQLA